MRDYLLFCVGGFSCAIAACSADGAPSNPSLTGGGASQGSSTGGNDAATSTGTASAGSMGTGGNGSGSGGGGSVGGTGGSGGSGGAGGAVSSTTGSAGTGGGGRAGAGGAGGAGGSNADAGMGPDAPLLMRGCSQPVRNGVMPGKESFTVLTPSDARFPFTKHWVGIFSDDPRFIGGESLTDLDNDGDLDYAIGQRTDLGGGMAWFEHCGPDQWIRHTVGTGHQTTAGGGAMDVNGDGFVDLVMSNSWYMNPGKNTNNVRLAASWQRYQINTLDVEENIIGDVNNDGKPDLLYYMTDLNTQWWKPGPDPTMPWPTGNVISMHPQRQGGAVGDIDGDGKNDVLDGNQWWYRNVNGDGLMWEEVHIDAGVAFDNEPLTNLGDLDGDGDMDLVMVTHWGGDTGARAAWFENIDGKGRNFTLHMLDTGLGWLHTVVAADFDNDGDLDIYVGKNFGPQWIWENDGKGHFTKHTAALDFRGHGARVADVDCDGDLDVVGSPWGDPNGGGEGAHPPRDVVYLQNMCVEMGSCKPVFDRPKEITFQKAPPYVCRR